MRDGFPRLNVKRLDTILVLTAGAILVACGDPGTVTSPETGPDLSERSITCVATVTARVLSCDSPQLAATRGMSLHVTVGGPQGTYVQLASSGTAYAGTAFTSSVTVEN